MKNSQNNTLRQKRRSVTTEFQAGNWEKPFGETFGKAYHVYRKNWERAGPDWIPNFPLHIDFQLMDECNMRCIFCPREKSVMKAMEATDLLNHGTKMSFDDFRQVIDEGEQYALRAINLGATSESLIHPEVVEMVRYARRHEVFDIRVVTNGLLLEDRMIRRLYEAGLTYLSVSIDAWTPETYRKVRRNDLKKVVANTLLAVQIRQEMSLDFPRIRVSFVDSPDSKGEFEPFLDFWKDKVDFIDLQDFDDYEALPSNFNFTCMEPYRRLMVWAAGTVGCIAWTAERFPYGHIHEQTIKECWESQAIRKLRASVDAKNYNAMCLGCYGKMPAKD